MRKLIYFMFILFFSCSNTNRVIKKESKKVRVTILDFNLTPPPCGYAMTASVYRAKVLDNNISYGKEILIYFICKNENNNINGENVYIEISKVSFNLNNFMMFNFTNYSDEKIKNEPKYEVDLITPAQAQFLSRGN